MALSRGRVVRAPTEPSGDEPTLTVTVVPLTIGASVDPGASVQVRVRDREHEQAARRSPLVPATGRVVAQRIIESEAQRDRILLGAYEEAARILAEAREQTKSAREDAEREGRAEATAALAAHWICTRSDEQRATEESEDRVLGAARALAERLLGRELALDPGAVVDLARVVLSAVSRARRVVIRAHGDDVEALQKSDLARFFEDGAAVQVERDDARTRGSLRVETDLGVLDGDLAPQLDRLVLALRGR